MSVESVKRATVPGQGLLGTRRTDSLRTAGQAFRRRTVSFNSSKTGRSCYTDAGRNAKRNKKEILVKIMLNPSAEFSPAKPATPVLPAPTTGGKKKVSKP